jgi:hypothetical protein
MATNNTCTPSGLAALVPCLNCLSASQLMLLLAQILATSQGYSMPGDMDQLLLDSKAFKPGKTDLLKLAVVAAAEETNYQGDFTVAGNALKSLPAVKPEQVRAALVYLLCKTYIE